VGIAVVAVVISLGAWIVSSRQLREARKANAFPAVIDLFREYRSDEMVAARRLMKVGLPATACPVHQISDDNVRTAALRLIHYYQNIGVLLHHELIRPEIVSGYLGVSAQRVWGQLAAFIQLEREERQRHGEGPYDRYFEHLIATIRQLPPEQVRHDLLTLPTSDAPSPAIREPRLF
jgi:hypothetical protein